MKHKRNIDRSICTKKNRTDPVVTKWLKNINQTTSDPGEKNKRKWRETDENQNIIWKCFNK